jgi:hypothetical protein
VAAVVASSNLQSRRCSLHWSDKQNHDSYYCVNSGELIGECSTPSVVGQWKLGLEGLGESCLCV